MKLQQLVNSKQFAEAWEAYEQGIIQEFGSVSANQVQNLHSRLEAARDFYLHLRETFRDEQSG